jgi:hypothetical protein
VVRELTLVTILLLMTSTLGTSVAKAQPSPPATFAGTVKVDGQRVPDGTPVLALVNGNLCGESSREPGQKGTWTVDKDVADLGMHAGDSIYIMDVASDSQTPGCGTEGATVTFLVNGQPTHEKGLWEAGFNSLDLTVGQAPTSTSTPQAQAPTDLEEDSDASVRWWIPAAGGGGAALVAAGLLTAVWRRRATTRRQT